MNQDKNGDSARIEGIMEQDDGDSHPVYENGKIVGYISESEIIDEDTWGGARIGAEWQIGSVIIDGDKYPLMSDGHEHYVVYDEVVE